MKMTIENLKETNYVMAMAKTIEREGFIVEDKHDYSSLIKDNIKVSFVELGEGYNGEYEESDQDDESLLRFDVYYRGNDEWISVDDASYCTLVPASASSLEKLKVLSLLVTKYHEVLNDNPEANVKRLGEQLSHISLEWLNN